MSILAIARNTYREAIRDKILYLLIVFGCLAILASRILGFVSIGDELKIIADISLGSISVFGALIAVFVGTNLVYKEVDKRTIYTILSRPISRYEFVIGKYLGLVGLLGVTTSLMALLSGLYIVAMGGAVDLMLAVSVFLIYIKLLLVTAVSILLSSLASPILGAIIVLAGYVFGHATGILIDLPPQFDDTLTKEIMQVVYYVTPNLSNFDIWQEYANGIPLSNGYIVWTIIYGLLYTSLIVYLATLAFERKDV
jgi:ABC-type transport system involved in multi-copper enzyme maturation permease subunit